MRKYLQTALILAAAMWAIAASTSADAVALTAKDIYGKWCSAGGSEEFTPNSLIAVRASDGVRIAFEIVSYKFTKTVVTVHWLSGKKAKVFTQFGEFSADGRGMVQFKSESGPRREFHRC